MQSVASVQPSSDPSSPQLSSILVCCSLSLLPTQLSSLLQLALRRAQLALHPFIPSFPGRFPAPHLVCHLVCPLIIFQKQKTLACFRFPPFAVLLAPGPTPPRTPTTTTPSGTPPHHPQFSLPNRHGRAARLRVCSRSSRFAQFHPTTSCHGLAPARYVLPASVRRPVRVPTQEA